MKKLLTGTALVLISTLLVNIGNYGLNMFLARFLGPSMFAEATALSTIVLSFSFIALGIQITAAKYLSEITDQELRAATLQNLKYFVNQASWVLAAVIGFSSWFIADFLQFESNLPFVVLALGIPSYFCLSIHRGAAQANQSFGSLSLSYFVEMIVRIIISVGLILMIPRVEFYMLMLSTGFSLSLLIAALLSRPAKSKALLLPRLLPSKMMFFFGSIMMYEFAQILINYSDLLMVKHHFSAETAGLYSSLSIIGKVVYFATWSIVLVMMPKVIEKEKKGEDHRSLFNFSLLIVAISGICIVLMCFFFGNSIIGLIMGTQYLAAAPLLWKYALSTCLFSLANIFCYYYMSLDKFIPMYIALGFGLAQITLLHFFHGSIEQVIYLQIALMSAFLVSMISFKLYQSHRSYIIQLLSNTPIKQQTIIKH